MVVVLNRRHISLNEKLAEEINKSSSGFNIKKYSKIENIDNMLLKRDISVEKKKNILTKKLHEQVVRAFSINKNKFNKTAFELLKKRLQNIRKIIIKLRSINYYLETILMEELMLSRINKKMESSKLKMQNALARDELEALEYAAYKLIGEVVMLDKRSLREYSHKEKMISGKEKIGIRGLALILKKESELLEHLDAKIPPPKAASAALMKEPNFTNWVARVFSLLSYTEHLYQKEAIAFGKLKKNKAAKSKIGRKISYITKERSSLIKIMEKKCISIKTFRIGNEIKSEIHKLTTTINL